MSYQITTSKREGYLLAELSGERTPSVVSAAAQELMDVCLKHGHEKLLVDVRQLRGRLGMLDVHQLVTGDFRRYRGRGLRKLAIVDWRESGGRHWFLDLLARNRGYNVRMFADPEAAAAWLTGSGAGEESE